MVRSIARHWAALLAAGLILFIVGSCTDVAFATEPAASDHQPPRFLPAIALYRDDRFVALEVGKTFSYTCKEALADTQLTLERTVPVGVRAVGMCIPVPTYSAEDLTPAAAPPKPQPDNTL